ncbi:glutaminase B [Fluctibacter corallii]
MQAMLDEIYNEVLPLLGEGRVADYIPALAKVDPNQVGIAVCDLHGNTYTAGDANTAFSIQSISKLLTLVLGMEIYGDALWKCVDKEPSGQAFNSLIQLEMEHGIPRNPFINAGALKVCDMLYSRLATPKQRMKEMMCKLSGNAHVTCNHTVADSERMHGARSAAMAYLMKAFKNFDNDVDDVLDAYYFACALEMNCVDLAKAFLFLANQGKTLDAKHTILTTTQTKQVNALMATCGMYNQAGDFAYRVGLPGKSGVGGGIVAIIPNHLSICVWSPELNDTGNSLIGIEILERFTARIGKSIY